MLHNQEISLFITSTRLYIKKQKAIITIPYGTYLFEIIAYNELYLSRFGVLILALATKREGIIIKTTIPQIPPVKSKTYWI